MNFPGGYRATSVYEEGAPRRAGSITIDGATFDDACSWDSQTDAIIPFSLTFTNTTSGFSFGPDAHFEAIDLNSALQNVIEEADTSGGSWQCNTQFPQDNVSWSNLSTGQSQTIYGYYLVSNFYSPEQPSGNYALLTGAQVSVSWIGNQGYAPTSMSDPSDPESIHAVPDGISGLSFNAPLDTSPN